MHIDELLGQHGVLFDDVLPLITPYEGMQQMEVSAASHFTHTKGNPDLRENPDTDYLKLIVPGAPSDYYVSYEGYEKAMRLAGFAESVITKYPVPLMIEPLNWGFQHRCGETIKAFIRPQDSQLVAFVKPSLELVSTEALMRKMNEVLVAKNNGQPVLYERLHHDMKYTSVSVVLASRERAWEDGRLKRNDVVLGGVNFHNSLMGECPTEVTGYVYRLTCGNGQISAECKFKWSRRTETTPLLDWFGERVLACAEGIEHEFDKIGSMIKMTVPEGHRAELLTNLFQEYELSDRMRGQVLSRLADEPPRHMWDIINAITNVANDEEYNDNPHTIRRLQKIGGDIATKLHVCGTCHSVTRSHAGAVLN